MRKMPFMDEDEPGIERYEAIRSFLASGSEFRSEWSTDGTFGGKQLEHEIWIRNN